MKSRRKRKIRIVAEDVDVRFSEKLDTTPRNINMLFSGDLKRSFGMGIGGDAAMLQTPRRPYKIIPPRLRIRYCLRSMP